MSNLRPPCDEAAILTSASAPSSCRAGRWILAATILGSSLAFIDGTVVNVALPALQAGLGATGTDVQWVVEAYALFLAALLLVGGSLGDVYGRRNTFVAGVVLFASASAWCGLAPSIHHLIAGRALQGIGGALLIPGSLALISASFPTEERGRAIGTWSGFTAITAAGGPVLGGWLVQHTSWRWVFFLNLPLATAVVVIALLRVPESRNQQGPRRLDWPGATLATLGLGGVTFALIDSTNGGRAAVIAGIVGIAMLLAFLRVEVRSAFPMLPLDLFRARNFTGANMLTFFLYAALGGVLFFLPLDLIQVQRYSPTQAGGALLPLILLIFLLSRWSGGLVQKYGARLPLIVGPAIAALGFALLARPGIGGSYWTTFFPAVVVLGIGMAVSVAPLTTVVMNSVSQDRAGSASGVNNAVSRVASLLALAVFGVTFAATFNRSLAHRLAHSALTSAMQAQIYAQRAKFAAIATHSKVGRALIDAAFVDAYRVVLWIAVALSLAAAVCAALMLQPLIPQRIDSAKTPRHPERRQTKASRVS
jgi:EmrB/QacA subfamily drug resistance transporter